MHWMILPYRRYFDFAGRSRRKEYWFAVLTIFFVIVAFGFGFVGLIAGNWQAMMDGTFASWEALGAGAWTLLALLGLFFIASIIPWIALQVRRLHDLGVSGWWYLAYVIGGQMLDQVPQVGSSLNSLLSLGWLVWMFFPGTAGSNKYGDDPKDPVSVSSVFA